MLNDPCMSCGENRCHPAPERCLHKANHNKTTGNDLSARLTESAAKYSDDENAAQIAASALQRLNERAQRGYKFCPRCERPKKPAEFGIDARESDGLNRICRACRTAGPLHS